MLDPKKLKKPRARMRREEQDFQKLVVRHLQLRAPKDLLWFHVPNGGYRSRAEAGILKAMGVLAGVADLVFVIGGRAHFLELKAPGGLQNDAQEQFQARCAELGVPYLVCETLAEVEGALAAWGAPLRGTSW